MEKEKVLITGAGGQLGSVLTIELQNKNGLENVIASDLKKGSNFKGYFEILDVLDFDSLNTIVSKYKITQIFHLAAILSANGEKDPLNTWDVNMNTFFNVLEVSRLQGVSKVFYPSSIAVFGADIDKQNTPQFPNLTPSTVYGMSKVAGENWSNYYYKTYGLDVRSIRYPGIIGYQSMPGGGTTDYAVDIFHKAINNKNFECFLEGNTRLPMIFIDDAIRATMELMEAPKESIKVRTSYNLAGTSFSPKELFNAIKKVKPNFEISYKPDFRQNIANTWPNSIDDTTAKQDWGWEAKFDLESMTKLMIEKLEAYYNHELIE
jgi:nucleoside-diphosphate-sugar epimerase